MRKWLLLFTLPLLACGGEPRVNRELALRRVVLYQNGIGYFERTGQLKGDRFRLYLRNHEIGDALKTLMVIDHAQGRQRAISAVLPQPAPGDGSKPDQVTPLDILLPADGSHELTVAYAVPTPIWKATYRVVLNEGGRAAAGAAEKTARGLLQGWAFVDNSSGEEWSRIELTLATGAPLTFAIDLRTPQYLERPDLTGQLRKPVSTGAVLADKSTDTDRDGDGLVDRVDSCPDAPGGSEGNGCPGLDTDKDGVLDKDDKCPYEPGPRENQGCPPPRKYINVTQEKIELLQKIFFAPKESRLRPAGRELLDEVVSVLKSRPGMRIHVEGHADAHSDGSLAEAMRVSQERASAVVRYLVDHGIEASRLTKEGYGPTRPINDGRTRDGQDKNRRAEFVIVQQGDEQSTRPLGAVNAAAVAQSAPARSVPQDVAGMVRYELRDPITIPKGTSSMVSIISQPGDVEEIYLFRADPKVPGSDHHPLRAARLRADLALEPGPVAVFARGTFVGEGLLRQMHSGETAFIPFALDSSTMVKFTAADDLHPARLLAVHQGLATVEDVSQRTSHYEIAVGNSAPLRLFLRHVRLPGYTATNLPPDTESNPDHYLIPLPIASGKVSVFAVEERQTQRQKLTLGSGYDPIRLGQYVENSALPAEQQRRLRELIRLQKDKTKLEAEIEQTRTRVNDFNDRSSELRENLRTIAKMANGAALQKELLAKLAESARQSEQGSRQLVALSESYAAATLRHSQMLQDLEFDVDAPTKP